MKLNLLKAVNLLCFCKCTVAEQVILCQSYGMYSYGMKGHGIRGDIINLAFLTGN